MGKMSLAEAKKIIEICDWVGDKPKRYYQALKVVREYQKMTNRLIVEHYKRNGWDYMECFGYYIDEELERKLRELEN